MGYEYYSYGIRIYKQKSTGMEKVREGIMKNFEKITHVYEKALRHGMLIYGGKIFYRQFSPY